MTSPSASARTGGRRPGRRPDRSGSSLVELVVAVVVLGTGVLGVVGLLALAGETRGRALRLEGLTRLVGEVADSLRATPPAEAGSRSGPGIVARWEPRRAAGALRIRIRAWRRDAPGDTAEAVVVVADTLPVLRMGPGEEP